ncbi:hypothetical protein VPH35_115697 [Triticum aestivum]
MAGGGAPAAPGAWIRRAGMRTAAPGCSTRPLPAMLRLQWVARALARQPCSAGWGGVAAPLPAWCYGAGRLASPAWLAAWWRGGGARPVVQPLLSFLPDPSQGRLGASSAHILPRISHSLTRLARFHPCWLLRRSGVSPAGARSP